MFKAATLPNLTPGSQFRYVFVTSGTRNATSTDIAIYNTFVDNPCFFDNIKDNIYTLEFTWLDESGTEVDFGNVDHSFTLEFITYTKQSDVNSYSSQFGIIDKKSYPDYLSTR